MRQIYRTAESKKFDIRHPVTVLPTNLESLCRSDSSIGAFGWIGEKKHGGGGGKIFASFMSVLQMVPCDGVLKCLLKIREH